MVGITALLCLMRVQWLRPQTAYSLESVGCSRGRWVGVGVGVKRSSQTRQAASTSVTDTKAELPSHLAAADWRLNKEHFS